MSNSRYRWVIVAAGGLLGCVAIGGMFSLPVLLQPIARDTGWSVTGISCAMTIGFLAMAFTSMIWGTLSDRLGPLPVVLTGSVVLAASLGLASLATSLIAFQFIFGLMVGGSIAAIFAPMMATVTGWFDTHRSLAVSLVSAGMGMAPMTMAPLAAWLVSNHDWRTSMQIVALVVAAIMIPVSLLVRRPPALAAIHHPARDKFLLLRHAFGPDHSHRELRHQLRHPAGRGRHHLQRRRPRRDGRPDRFRSARRSPWRQARAGVRSAGAGVRRTRLCLRARARRVLCGRGAVRLHLCRHHAALRRAGARKLSAADDGHRDRRHRHGRQPRHGDGAARRRSDLRHLRQLRLALYRLMDHGPRCFRDRLDVQAGAISASRAGAGVR